MNSNYTRVIPRDLFNEAKLLKCMGRLCLLILDNQTPVQMESKDTGEPFKIALLDEGVLTITNVEILINDKPYQFQTTYNCKSNYPLFLVHDYCEYQVFNDDGTLNDEFINFCKDL